MLNKKINVLIVDDDEVDCIMIKRTLKHSGYDGDVFTASDIETGMSLVNSEKIDFIFLDYSLPGNNGFQFLENYKSSGGKAPVIIITSQKDEKLEAEAMKKGAFDYITKNMITAECVSQILRESFSTKISETENTITEYSENDSEKKLEVIIAATPLILFSIDECGIFTLFKGKGIEKLKVNTDEVKGKSIFESGNELPVRLNDYKNALSGNPFHASVEANDHFFEVHYVPVQDDNKNSGGIKGVAIDITELKKNEQELIRALNITEEAQKIKEIFLANMSHEIRTPVHGIMNLTDILLKTKISDEQHTYLDAIKRSADNLLVIINDILDLSKIEAQKMKFENIDFKLRDVVNNVMEMFKPKMEEKNIGLVLKYDSELPEYINGDPVRLSQVINNLISNAIKFTHDGEVKLEVSSEEKNDKCCLVSFRVSDTGIGIPQHKLTSIFDSFSQAGDDTTRKYGGTGLGLSICKKLIELQGGMINVESKLNTGSVFTFRLSFENVNNEVASVQAAKITTEVSFDKELKLLVVEDNEISRMVINVMMRDWGFKIDNAENGSVAVDMIGQNDYDVVLMDIEMPGMNGYRTTEHIRKNLSAPKNQIPILAMTAHANASEKEKCLHEGMNDYVSKPFDAAELKNKIIELSKLVNAEKIIPEPVSGLAEERCTNLTFLRQLSENNDSFFKDFIRLFLENAPVTVNDLVTALERKDWAAVRQAAHKIKPSLSYLGMKEIHQAALKAEEFAKAETNLNEIPPLVKKIKDTCDKAYLELEKELKELSVN